MSQPSRDREMHLAHIRTNQWMHAVELQLQRCLGPVSNRQDGVEDYRLEWNQRQLDIEFFVISLRRLRLVVEASKRRLGDARLKPALRAFDARVPDVVHLRDIAEHIDEFDRGMGGNKPLTAESPSHSWGPDSAEVSYGGLRLDLQDATEAARELHGLVMQVLHERGHKVDLSQWPLVNWEPASE